MAKDTTLTVDQWLDVRRRVAKALAIAGSHQEESTRLRVAESLMSAGYIDVQAVKDDIDTERAATSPEILSDGGE